MPLVKECFMFNCKILFKNVCLKMFVFCVCFFYKIVRVYDCIFSVYGKTMENVRERVDVRLVDDDRKLKKLVAKPSFKRFKIFNDDLVGVEMKRVTIELNRPAYLGAQILDISKNLMTTFHYEVMKQKYGD